jgi:hypothetical protein
MGGVVKPGWLNVVFVQTLDLCLMALGTAFRLSDVASVFGRHNLRLSFRTSASS